MKGLLTTILVLVAIAGLPLVKSDSEGKMEARAGDYPCPFHACTPELLGCERLKLNENGCLLCECAEDIVVPVVPGSRVKRANEKRAEDVGEKGSCLLIPDAGPCKAAIVRYYFDRAASGCLKFAYGGCQGNNNNFETLEDCRSTCKEFLIDTGKPKARASTPEKVPCPLHSCTAEILNCADGLALNDNGCELCECAEQGGVIEQPIPCPAHACTKEILNCPGVLARDENGCKLCKCADIDPKFGVRAQASESTKKGICLLIPDAGPCRGHHERFYFDRAANLCKKFLYGGCHGNKNNFKTLKECQVSCEGGSEQSNSKSPCPTITCTPESLGCLQGTGLAIDENMCKLCKCAVLSADMRSSEPNDKGICMLVPDAGSCRGIHERFYFDRAANTCKKFLYGGCYGNKNNFETFKECVLACGRGSEPNDLAETPEVPCPLHSCTAEMLKCPAGTGLARNEYGCELCECEDAGVVEKPLPCPLHACTKEVLECPGELAVNENGCELCECAEFSAKTRSSEPTDKGICMLPPDAGSCRGIHERFYFDRAANLCKKFLYGGCHGNKNNFETLKECNLACGRGSEPSDLADTPEVPCPLHSCTAEMLKCPAGTGLARNEYGCELCECEDAGVVEKPLPCPLHACTKEVLECPGELAVNENGCELCECAEFSAKTRSSEPTDKGICMLPPDAGSCRGIHERFYFDRAANLCKKFLYGGCHGNKNNFETLKECNLACGRGSEPSDLADTPEVPCPLHSCTAEMLKCPAGTGLARNEYGCELCECEDAGVVEKPLPCPLHACTKEVLECPGELAVNENGCELCECAEFSAKTRSSEPTDKGICMLLPDAGSCRGIHERFYFDRAANLCKKFLYGGCHGNKNNFETLKECNLACGRGSEPSDLADTPEVPCPLHSCTAEMLKCPAGTGLARSEYGCELCECEDSGIIEKPIACPLHACTKEILECVGELAVNANGCVLCECAENTEPVEPTEFPPEPVEPGEEVVESSECQRQREEGLALSGKVQDGPFIPSCDDDGSFSSLQCYWDECWCVLNPDGREVKGTRVPNSQRNTLECYDETGKEPIQEKEQDEQIARREIEAALKRMVEEADMQ